MEGVASQVRLGLLYLGWALLWSAVQVLVLWPTGFGWRIVVTDALLTNLVLAIGGTLAQFRTLLGSEAGVALIVLLLVLKTLEMRARRDAMVLFFLGFFTLLTLFFQSQSLLTALAMLLGLFAVGVTPREEEPQINVTMANVLVPFPGASVKDVETLVATPAEQVLSQIQRHRARLG